MRSTGTKGGALLGGGLVASAAKFAAPLAAAFGIGKIFRAGFAEAADAAKNNAQLAAGIASTGNAAGVTVASLNAHAGSLQLSTGQTDDSIAAAQGLLLTFTNIKNVGADKIFDQATLAAANMAARLGGDASSSALQLGKALNDPIAGITSLSRAGVQFTDGQKDQIKTLVEAGDVLGAQKIILGELETQFGGSAVAAGQTFPGQMEILKRSFEDFSQMAVGRFGPSLATGLGFLSTGIQAATPIVDTFLTGLGPRMLGLASSVGATFGPAFASIGASLAPVLPQLVSLLSALSPLGIVIAAAGPQLLTLAVSLGGLLGAALTAVLPAVTSLSTQLVTLLGGVLDAVLPAVTAFSNWLTANIGPVTAFAAVIAGGVIAFQAYATVVTIVRTVTTLWAAAQAILNVALTANPVGVLIVAIGALVAGIIYVATQTTFFQDTWTNVTAFVGDLLTNLGSFFTDVFQGIGNVIRTVFGFIASFVTTYITTVRTVITTALSFVSSLWSNTWGGIVSFFSGVWQNISGAVSAGIGAVLGFLGGLPGRALSAIGNLGDLLVGAGRNMIDGLIKGVKQVTGNIAEAVLAPIRDAVDGVKSFLGIASPSRLFMQIGAFTGEGMAIGLERSAGLVAKASEALIPTAPTAPSVTAPALVAGGVVGALAAAAAAARTPAPDRPVYLGGGGLFGMIREVANGEARLVLEADARDLERGYRR